MTWRRLVVIAVLAAAATGGIAVALAPSAAGRPAARASCKKPYIDSLNAQGTSSTTAAISATFSSEDGGSWTIDISSPQTAKFGGVFAAGQTTINRSLGGLTPHTHYRGTLSVHNGCGSTDVLIDFRTAEAPPPPACTGPPSVDSFAVSSVTTDSAVVGYNVSSGDAATVRVTVSPAGVDVSAVVSPPSGAGQVPLTGLAPATTYTVALSATNGCGVSTGQLTFTTMRLTDCSLPPSIDALQVSAIRPRSAALAYRITTDGVGTAEITVSRTHIDVVRQISPSSASGKVSLPKLDPGTRYRVTVAADNECGHAEATRAFTSLAQLAVLVKGSGRVTSEPGGISCPRSCTAAFAPGAVVRLTARPRAKARFLGWEGACRGSRLVCTVRAGKARVVARFSRS